MPTSRESVEYFIETYLCFNNCQSGEKLIKEVIKFCIQMKMSDDEITLLNIPEILHLMARDGKIRELMFGDPTSVIPDQYIYFHKKILFKFRLFKGDSN